MQLGPRIADVVLICSQAGEDLVGLEGDHAADGDPRVADCLKFLDGCGVGRGTPALGDAEGLEAHLPGLASGQELVLPGLA